MYGRSLLECPEIVDSIFVRLRVITPDVFAFGPIEDTVAVRNHALAKVGHMAVCRRGVKRNQCSTEVISVDRISTVCACACSASVFVSEPMCLCLCVFV